MFLFASCNPDERPKDVLSQTQFSALLVEMYIAEARTENARVPRDSALKFFLPRESAIYKKMGISDSVVKKTYSYYMEHTKELEQVYSSVIDTLVLRERAAYNVPSETKPIQSLKKMISDKKIKPQLIH